MAALFRSVSAAILLLCAGCVSAPPPAYRQIDRKSDTYQEALAHEVEQQIANGKSKSEAQNGAEKQVDQQFVKAEKKRRTELVKPLQEALAALERPAGCWACTVTTTTITAKQTSKRLVQVERFDPFQPENRLWTLVSVNGVAPDEKKQQSYRHAKLRNWKNEQKKQSARKPPSEYVRTSAILHEFSCAQSELTNQATYTFERGPFHMTGVADEAGRLEVYTVDTPSRSIIRHYRKALGPTSLLGIRIEEDERSTDYIIVDPTLPPFVAKTTFRLRGKYLGADFGLTEVEAVYSDYCKVKCYDDRFEVKAGELSVLEILPTFD